MLTFKGEQWELEVEEVEEAIMATKLTSLVNKLASSGSFFSLHELFIEWNDV